MFDQLINGLVIGNLYALTAVGITQIYGVANVVNFAHGSLYMLGAYVGWMAATWWHLPLPVTFLLVMGASALMGIALERIAIRPFSKAGRTVLLLSTIGAALVLDQAAQIIWGPETQALHHSLASWRIPLGGGSIGALDLLILGVGAGAALLLHLFLSKTKAGWAVRATAQDRDAAQQMGVDVDAVSRISFAIAGALAGVSGLLVGLYYQNVYPTMGFTASIKGFVAALMGGLGNIPGAIGAAWILGVSESMGVAWLGSSYRELVAVGLLIGILLFKPAGLFASGRSFAPEPMTGTFVLGGRSIRIPKWVLFVAIGAAVILPLVTSNPYWIQVMAMAWIFGLVAVSLNFLAGTAGQVSLGHAGFLALGAYASAILTRKLHLPFELSLIISPVISAIIGVLLCYPALRLKGQYLAIATLGLGQAIGLIALNWESLTGGAVGISNIQPPSLFGYQIVLPADFYWLALGLLLVSAWFIHRLGNSHVGRALRAVREDEVAAEAYAIGLLRYKAIAFGASAFFAAVAGVLLAHSYSYIAHDTFTHSLSILALTMVVLGGLDSVPGVIVGAVLLYVLPESGRFLAEYRYVIYGVLLLVLLRFRPRGLLGSAS